MIDKRLDPEKVKQVQATKWYPKFHVAPPIGWLNDPNGFNFYNGEYHIFYQYHPYRSKWGPMHWGHATTKDFVHWTDQPIAITPGGPFDYDGCFSGCTFEKDGKLYLMYTGQTSTKNYMEHTVVLERQCLAVSEDGINFTKFEDKPYIEAPVEQGVGNVDFRDPKIWEHDGKYYCAIGDKTPDKTNTQIVLFESDNFFDWRFKSVVASARGNEGKMWECPCFSTLESGEDIMIISPQHVNAEGRLFNNLHQAGYMLGKLDYETGVFTRGKFYTFDHGFDFYATTMAVVDGRTLIIGWLAMWETLYPEQPDGWCCMLTMPREVHKIDGKVTTPPVAEAVALRDDAEYHVSYKKPIVIDKKTKLDGVRGNCGELLIEVENPNEFKIELFVGEDCGEEDVEKTILKCFKEDGKTVLALNRNLSGAGAKGVREVELQPFGDTLKFRIFLDKSALEIFINDGTEVMTTRVYPRPESQDINFIPTGAPLKIKSLDFYKL